MSEPRPGARSAEPRVMAVAAPGLRVRRIGPVVVHVPERVCAELSAGLPPVLLEGGEVHLVDGELRVRLVYTGPDVGTRARLASDEVGLSLAAVHAVATWPHRRRRVAGDVVFDVEGAANIVFHSAPTAGGQRRLTTVGVRRLLGVELCLDGPADRDPKEAQRRIAEVIRAARAAVGATSGRRPPPGGDDELREVELVEDEVRWRLRGSGVAADVLAVVAEAPRLAPDPGSARAAARALREAHGAEPVRRYERLGDVDWRIGSPPELARVEVYDIGDAWRFATVGLPSTPGSEGSTEVVLELDKAEAEAPPPAWVARWLAAVTSRLATTSALPRRGEVLDVGRHSSPADPPTYTGALWVASSLAETVVDAATVRFVAVVPLSDEERRLAEAFGAERFADVLSMHRPLPRRPPHELVDADSLGLLAHVDDDVPQIAGLVGVGRLPDGGLELSIEGPLTEVLAMLPESGAVVLSGSGGRVTLHRGGTAPGHREVAPAVHAVWVPEPIWQRAADVADLVVEARAGAEPGVLTTLDEVTAVSLGAAEVVRPEPEDPLPRLRERARRLLAIYRGAGWDEPDAAVVEPLLPTAQDRFLRALRACRDPRFASELQAARRASLVLLQAVAVVEIGADADDPFVSEVRRRFAEHPAAVILRGSGPPASDGERVPTSSRTARSRSGSAPPISARPVLDVASDDAASAWLPVMWVGLVIVFVGVVAVGTRWWWSYALFGESSNRRNAQVAAAASPQGPQILEQPGTRGIVEGLDQDQVCWIDIDGARCQNLVREPPLEPASGIRTLVGGPVVIAFTGAPGAPGSGDGGPRGIEGAPLSGPAADPARLVEVRAKGTVCRMSVEGRVACTEDGAPTEQVPGRFVELIALDRDEDRVCALRDDGAPICWGTRLPSSADPASLGPLVDLGGTRETICGVAPDLATVRCLGPEAAPALDLGLYAPLRGITRTGRYLLSADGTVLERKRAGVVEIPPPPLAVVWQRRDVRCLCAMARRTCERASAGTGDDPQSRLARYQECKRFRGHCEASELAVRQAALSSEPASTSATPRGAPPPAQAAPVPLDPPELDFTELLEEVRASVPRPWPGVCEPPPPSSAGADDAGG